MIHRGYLRRIKNRLRKTPTSPGALYPRREGSNGQELPAARTFTPATEFAGSSETRRSLIPTGKRSGLRAEIIARWQASRQPTYVQAFHMRRY